MTDVDFLALVPSAAKLDEESDQRFAEYEARHEAHLEAARLDSMRRSLVESGCPVKDLARVLDSQLDPTDALRLTRLSCDASEVLIALSGRPGCGKTTAAAWWLLQARDRIPYVTTSKARFVAATTLARWPKYDEGRMDQLLRCRALVIDDLGVEYGDKNGAFSSMLDEVINSRYAATLPTLITTNLSSSEFKDRYGERIADRIRESGRFVAVKGESLRGAK